MAGPSTRQPVIAPVAVALIVVAPVIVAVHVHGNAPVGVIDQPVKRCRRPATLQR